MNLQHNNHFVPQMYLNAWGTDKKIYRYRLLVSNEKVPLWSRQSIEHTASQDFLYIHVVDGIENDDLEKEFNEKFETPAMTPLMNAINGERMSPDDWEILINFVVAQYVRTPKFYLQNKQIEEQIIPGVMEEVSKELAEMDSPPPIEKHDSELSSLLPVTFDLIDKTEDGGAIAKITMIAGKSTWLLTIKHLLSDDSVILSIMRSRKWSIAQADPDILLPTCDNPFIIFSVNSQGVYSITDGLGKPENIFAFPISPHKVLLSTSKRIRPRLQLTKEETIMIKNLIVDNSYDSVYSYFEDPEIPKMRARIVNEELFKENQAKFDNWYEVYKEQEGPFLHRR